MELPASQEMSSPQTWRWTTIGNAGQVQLGKAVSPKERTGPNLRPYLRVANVYEDLIDLSSVKEMNFTPQEFEKYRIEPGDLLLCEGQTPELVGRAALVRTPLPGFCFQNHLVRFRANPEVLPGFALAVFRQYLHTGRFAKIAQITTNIAHMGSKRFSEIEFPVPPMSEQLRIVDAIESNFARLDSAVTSLQRVESRLTKCRSSILTSAFRGKLIQGTDPRTWEASSIGEALQIIDYRGRTPPYSSEGIPHLRSQNIKAGRVIWDDLAHVTQETFDAYMTRGLPQPGDVLFTTEAPLGQVAMAPAERRFSLAQRVVILHPKSEHLAGKFVMYQLMSDHFQAILHGRGTGSTVQGISARNFRPAIISWPRRSEQNRIVEEIERKFSTLESVADQVKDQLERAATLRRSILNSAFEGRLLEREPSETRTSSLLGVDGRGPVSTAVRTSEYGQDVSDRF